MSLNNMEILSKNFQTDIEMIREKSDNYNKITVIIIGDSTSEHSTFIKYNKEYYSFYTDGCMGVHSKEVINFLKFLGCDVFEVYKNCGSIPVIPVNRKYEVYV